MTTVNPSQWTLTTHVPQELITMIFSWIHPYKVHKFRSTCRLINDLLMSSLFHTTNTITLFPTPNMASNHGTRILIKYAVFPDLDTVSTSWQFGHLNSSGRIKWDETDDIILIAKNIVRMLKLGNVQNVSPDTVWHRTVESTTTVNSNTITTKMHERPADNKAPKPFDPRTDVLVFVPEALKDRITSVPLITVYPNIATRQPRRRLVPNIQIKYFISPHMSHQFQTCIRGLPNRDTVVSWDGLLGIRDVNIIAATISSDHNLGNVIVRGVPTRSRQNSSFEPTDLFQPDKSGHTTPFSLWTHDLVLYPVDGNVGVSQETEERWTQLFSRGGRLLASCCSVEGMKEFDTLMYETKNVYGIQHERIYETVVGIASILYHEKCFLPSARIILDYFTEPQVASVSSATVDNAVDVVRKLSLSWTQQNNPGVVHLPITQASLRLAQDFCIASIKHKNLQLAARMARSNGQVLTLAKKYKEADGIYRSYFSNLTKMTLDYSLYHVFALKAFAANLLYQESYSEAAHRYQDVFSKRALFPVVEYFKTNLINSLILNMDYETCLPYVIEHCHNQCATCVKEGCVGGVCSERMKNWGTCYFHVGNIEEALPIFQKHQIICERLYGKDSLKTFETMRMIGRCLESKDPISSHQLYDKVEARYSTEPGKNNSNIQLIEWSRGSLWFQTGELEKAEEIWIKVLAERRQYNSSLLLESIHSLARLYESMGSFEKAEQLFREHVEILEGDEYHSHYQLVKALVWLASNVMKQGDREAEAVRILEKAHLEYTRVNKKLNGAAYLPVVKLFEAASGSLITALMRNAGSVWE